MVMPLSFEYLMPMLLSAAAFSTPVRSDIKNDTLGRVW